jgi:hypothetical protein
VRTLTTDQLFEFGIYDEDEEVLNMCILKDEWSALDILALDTISAYHRVHTVLHGGLIEDSILLEFAYDRAADALVNVKDTDRKMKDLIVAMRNWLSGKIQEIELPHAWVGAGDIKPIIRRALAFQGDTSGFAMVNAAAMLNTHNSVYQVPFFDTSSSRWASAEENLGARFHCETKRDNMIIRSSLNAWVNAFNEAIDTLVDLLRDELN